MTDGLLFITTSHPLYDAERKLRWEVMRRPLGMPVGSEVFPFEDESLHLVLVEGGDVVGCVLFHADEPAGGRLFQMAVREALHGKGYGRQLVRHLEAHLVTLGVSHVHLHARASVSGFYAALGYTPFGDPYEEVGIPHVSMERTLGSDARVI